MRWAYRIVAACVGIANLTGCATDGQRGAASMQSRGVAALKEARACEAPALADPKYAPLWYRMPKPGRAPSLAQQASTDYASPAEIALIEGYNDATAPCRAQAYSRLVDIDGRLADFFGEHFVENDRTLLALVQQKTTWGEAVQDMQRRMIADQRQAAVLMSQMNSEFAQQDAAEREHRAEVAQRIGEGLGAALQGAAVAAAVVQASRPVMTTCVASQNYASCMSSH